MKTGDKLLLLELGIDYMTKGKIYTIKRTETFGTSRYFSVTTDNNFVCYFNEKEIGKKFKDLSNG